jgi:hypothetical protein
MKRLLAATLFLAVAGCSSSRFDEDRPTTMALPPTEQMPATGQVFPQNLSPAARAAAPETGPRRINGMRD